MSDLLEEPHAHILLNRAQACCVPRRQSLMRRTAEDATNRSGRNKKAAGANPDG